MSDNVLALILFVLVYLTMAIVCFMRAMGRKHRKPTRWEVIEDNLFYPGMMFLVFVAVYLTKAIEFSIKLFKKDKRGN